MLAARLTFPSTAAKERFPNHKRRAPVASRSMEVCRYWMQDRCTRRPCPYVHPPKKQQQQKKKFLASTYHESAPVQNQTWRRPPAVAQHVDDEHAYASSCSPKRGFTLTSHDHDKRVSDAPPCGVHVDAYTERPVLAPPCGTGHIDDPERPALESKAYTSSQDAADKRVCGTEEQHALNIANLIGHDAAVKGIAFPFSSQALFSVGEDAMLRSWDYSTGLCRELLHLGRPASCLFNSFSDPNWLFVGLPDEVRVCNLSTNTQQTLAVSSPVLSLSSLGDLLVAGLQQGAILVWKFESSSASFHPFRCLSGGASENDHTSTSPVLSLEPSSVPGSNVIYAGCLDGMIRVWDIASGSCLQALRAHDKAITRLLSCDHTWLLSASQDGAIKLWKVYAGDRAVISLQDTFMPRADRGSDEHGCDDDVGPLQALAICGVFDEGNTPILFAAYSDNKVHIMEVPSFKCKGTIRTDSPIEAMDTGSGNILLLGSTKGDISVWKWK